MSELKDCGWEFVTDKFGYSDWLTECGGSIDTSNDTKHYTYCPYCGKIINKNKVGNNGTKN